MTLGPDGLVVLVDSEEGEIDVPSRIGKVVRASAEESDLELGGGDEPNVSVLLVLVEVVLAARVERHGLAARPRFVEALLLQTSLDALLCGQQLRVGHSRLVLAVDLVRDV